MALEDDVKEALKGAGLPLPTALLSDTDEQLLRQRAMDLIGLQKKLLLTDDPAKQAQYQLAAEMVVQHVELLVLIRLQLPDRSAFQRIFIDKVKDALKQLLPGLF